MTSHLYHLNKSLRFATYAFLALIGLSFNTLHAQDEIRINQFNGVDACEGTLTDDGGSLGLTTAGTNQITICSNSGSPLETHVRLNFTTISIGGTIEVYNGFNVDPDTRIGIPIDATANGTNLTFEASAANASGCLTVVYNSVDNSVGFEALISCTRACQPVVAELASSDPAVAPVDTGYIDVCIGQEITFNGRGVYSENGLIYDQSDETSTFQWNFDDGNNADTPTATYSYDEPGGYTVQLFITDANGCTNNNLISQRVRVSPVPSFNLQNDFQGIACADDTLTLRGSTQFSPNSNSEILVTTTEESFGASQVLADTTFLPDGNGTMYSTTLQFNNFEPGQVVTDVNDIISVCLNMEHSYAGDLDLYLTCPNGNRVTFIDFNGPGLGGQYFGIPIDIDADLSPGTGYDYCFVPDPELLSIAEQAIQNGTDPNNAIASGNYTAITDSEWGNLIGCPLNGDWTINIQDNLFSDNGYIFSWGITFADYLFSDLETFTVGIEQSSFVETDDLLFYSADSIVAIPNAAGNQQYTYSVTDEFGCVFDTTLTIQVLPVSHPDCYNCQSILDTNLQEENVGLGAEVQTTLATETALYQDVAFRVAPADPFGATLYPNLGNSYTSQLEVTNINPGGITNTTDQLVSVCVTMEVPQTGGVQLLLQAPDGTPLQLSTSNGGAGSNYTQTCFTPSATTSISDGTPPFTGNFLPDGDFSMLDGAPIEGTWTMRAWDISGTQDIGQFVSWSITFKNQNDITYTWTPDNGTLSCTDCPNPVITVDGETNVYNVTATDSYGCTDNGTVNIVADVDVVVNLTGNNVSCFGAMDGNVFASIGGGLPPYTISWNTDHMGDSLLNVGPGTYIITVSDINGTTDSDTIVISEPDELVITTGVVNVGCNGEATGSIDVDVAGGTSPYTIQPDNLENLVADNYTISVVDANGCTAEVAVEVTEPEAITLSAETTGVSCNGEADGTINLTVNGGTGNYTYAWSNDAVTEDLDGLSGGNYTVVVTDENNCTAQLSVVVNEASAIEVVSLTLTNLTCFEDNSGEIAIEVTGGTADYTYNWTNGGDAATISNLAAGTYAGTVTDAAGCSIFTGDQTLTQPEELTCSVTVVQEPDQGDNGVLVANAQGGTGDYTYVWSNDQTTQQIGNLTSGEYCVTITDENGCTTECCGQLQAFATVGDYVFFDDNRNGIQDTGESGLGGVTVVINSTDGSYSETTTTSANGNYSFLVPPGEYTIAFMNPGGLAASPANQGGDDAVDSDIIEATFTTAPFSLVLNEENLTIDAGFFDPCVPGLTSAGTIADDQTLCGPGNAPAMLTQVTPPTGGTGNYNYIWMKTTGDPNAPIQNWTPIQNTNSINYQPEVIYETTYYTRCVRQDECPYIESNIVMIEVGDDASANFSGPILVCEGETVTYVPQGLTNNSNVNWTVGGGASLVVNPDNSATITWASFGGFDVTLSNTENGCTASTYLHVTVSPNPDNCANTLTAPSTNVAQFDAPVVANAAGPLAKVFPNPTIASQVQLRLFREATVSGQTVEVQLFNATGSLLATQVLEAGPQQLKLDAFKGQPAGLYMVRVTQDGETETHRVILR